MMKRAAYDAVGKGFDMASIPVAQNVQAATIAGFLAVLLEHVCSANGIVIPPDVADALPSVLVIAVAHLWDCMTGENKP